MKLTPICGMAPLPGMASWNLDASLLVVLLLGAAATLRLTWHQGMRSGLALVGWALLALALVSPLCSISVALFSMRVTQHLVISLIAAPLLASAIQHRPAIRRGGVGAPTIAFALLLWFWHLPAPYVATFAPDGIAYWLMHASLAGSAIWFWAALLRHGEARPVAAALGGLATAIQMGVLGALLTFAPRPLYIVHAPDVTLPWGFTPLEDQQLGGLLMWVPGGLLLVLVLGTGLALMLRTPRSAALPLALLLALPVTALAQGNQSTTTTSAASGGRRSGTPVGVLTTSAVTTGDSGPSAPTPSVPEGAGRHTRVLGPVCFGLAGPVLEDCRVKSGMGPQENAR
ncbi:cytochrome c oxidase assembly protein [Falsiroseomonas tokyonensis]|uniref:Cytochrome c oxidase assembly protein n=1 Tax=Falsiroseomonas tokyonensis TaxID=430521 RepID=A0ABV7BPM2_9PROT|nr:cytochrome c oxidase assembly protein [Falsiroseomonas tokyonensis]MBU8536594.1 cytochrome c oxidase assembly protein [Falsiroseomonas tokyonensis]